MPSAIVKIIAPVQDEEATDYAQLGAQGGPGQGRGPTGAQGPRAFLPLDPPLVPSVCSSMHSDTKVFKNVVARCDPAFLASDASRIVYAGVLMQMLAQSYVYMYVCSSMCSDPKSS